MKVLAAFCSLLLVAVLANAQADLRAGPYTISGMVLSQNANPDSEVDIRLLTDSEVTVATARVRTLEPFRFRGLPNGTYYIELEAPGLRTTRQRVEFLGIEREVNVTVMPESRTEFVFRSPQDYTGEPDVVDVRDAARSPEALKQFQDALKKLQKGDLNGARIRLESLLASAPDFYDGHKTLGVAYQQSGRYREAEAQFGLARGLRPTSPAPLIHLGSLYLEEAEKAKDSDSPQQDMVEKARDVLQRAIQLNPGAAFARYLLGVAYYRLGSYADAEKALVRSLDLDPSLGNVRLALANVYIKVQDWSKALTHLDTYLKDYPRSSIRESVLSTRTKIAEIARNGEKNGAKESGKR
jgi:Tfp pilus assembly protein PilF